MTPDPIRAALNGLRILINEYDPNNSDWFFRKGCMLELLLDIAIALPIGVPVPGDPETTLLRIISDILEKTGLSAKPMRLSDLGDAIVAEMERRVAAETSTLKMALHDVTDGITAACNEAAIRAAERERCAGPDLLAVMEKECWTLRCVDIPTGGGDADVAWDVVSHHMAKPHDRVIATGNTPIKALAAAIRAGGER